MPSKNHADGGEERDTWNEDTPYSLSVEGSTELLGAPLEMVGFCWTEEHGESYEVECPYCNGELHHHNASNHHRLALGGISPARCKASGERYYLVLVPDTARLPYEVIHRARQELTNLPGDELQQPLVPKGIDPRVVDDLLSYWTDGIF